MDAVANLVAWRLDLAHVDPSGLLTFISGGSERYSSGLPVLLRVVSGHRDTGFTTCPGEAFYRQLNALAVQAARTGLPKIYEPRVEAGEGLFRVPCTAVVGRPVGRLDHEPGRLRGRAGDRHECDGRLDLGLHRRAARELPVDDLGRLRSTCGRVAARGRRIRRCSARGRGVGDARRR